MSNQQKNQPHMDQVRQHLLDTLASLRDQKTPMSPAQARAIADVAGVVVDSARVEVAFLQATQNSRSSFFDDPSEHTSELPKPSDTPTPHNPFPVSRRNLITR